MRNKKLWFILVPIVLVIVILIGVFVSLKINSRPQKIFKKVVSEVFDAFDSTDIQYNTLKENIEITGNIESNDASIKKIKSALEKSKIVVDSEFDGNALLANEKINIIYNNEDFLNAELLLQDQKVYVAFKNWLNKYIEVPAEDSEELKELGTAISDVNAIDINLLVDALKTEILNELSKQKFSQRKVSLLIDGKNEKVTRSYITLTEEQLVNFIRNILQNLIKNNNFQEAFGQYKNNVIEEINKVIGELPSDYFDEDSTIMLSIYTKGLFNKFVGIDISIQDMGETTNGVEFITSNDKMELNIYGPNKEVTNKIVVENIKDNNTSGTLIIKAIQGAEEHPITIKYNNNNDQFNFQIVTKIYENDLTITGNVLKQGETYSGNINAVIETAEIGKVNINCKYKVEFNANIEKKDVSNAVTRESMSKEDETTLITNMENSSFYKLFYGNMFGGLIQRASEAASKTQAALESEAELALELSQGETNNEKNIGKIARNNFTIKYNIASGCSYIFGWDEEKKYSDEKENLITVKLENNIDEYLKSVEQLSSIVSGITDVKIDSVKNYKLNGNSYKYRTATYKKSGEQGEMVNLYFAFELDENNCYVVEVESKDGDVSLDDVNQFLTIQR